MKIDIVKVGDIPADGRRNGVSKWVEVRNQVEALPNGEAVVVRCETHHEAKIAGCSLSQSMRDWSNGKIRVAKRGLDIYVWREKKED